jgi:acyl-CoA thioesterase-1
MAMFAFAASADAATVVALGASNTFGKGVARNQAYPAQLEAILRAKGANVRVVNAGINGDTTEGMLQRLDRAVPNGTSAVILQPGGNDRRKGSPDRTSEIQSRLSARGIPVIMIAERHAQGLPHQPDGQHLTPEATTCSPSRLRPKSRGHRPLAHGRLPGYCPRIMIRGSALSGTRRHCALSSASNCQVSPLADSSSIRP